MSASDPASEAALCHLRSADPVLARLIAAGRPIAPAAHEDLYLGLLRAIVSQQISTKAAAAIWRKFQRLFGPEGYPEPVGPAGVFRRRTAHGRSFAPESQLPARHRRLLSPGPPRPRPTSASFPKKN